MARVSVSSSREAQEQAILIVSARFRSTPKRWKTYDGVAATVLGEGGTRSPGGAGPGRRLAQPPHQPGVGAVRLDADHLLLEDRRHERLDDRLAATDAHAGEASDQLVDGRITGGDDAGVLGPHEGGECLQRPGRAPVPHARMVISPRTAPARIRVVAGPSGVRVARQTPSAPMRIVGSVMPRRRGPSVRRRSTG